jgi:hypothetical protein
VFSLHVQFALELKPTHPICRKYSATGAESGVEGWGVGTVLYGSVKEWWVARAISQQPAIAWLVCVAHRLPGSGLRVVGRPPPSCTSYQLTRPRPRLLVPAHRICQARKGLRKFRNFEQLKRLDGSGITDYVFVGDTGELDLQVRGTCTVCVVCCA